MSNCPFPHCDEQVLHAPGECVFCDKYPDRQAARQREGINFTGHQDADKDTCPAERNRPIDTINHWHGNVPMTQVMIEEYDKEYAKLRKQFPGVLVINNGR